MVKEIYPEWKWEVVSERNGLKIEMESCCWNGGSIIFSWQMVFEGLLCEVKWQLCRVYSKNIASFYPKDVCSGI